jgi:ABC-type transporter Mla subunit MlaD
MAQSETTFLLMAIAVAVSSVSLLMSAVASIGLFRAVKRLEEKVEPLIPQAVNTLRQAEETLTATVTQVRELSDQARNLMEATQTQLDHFSEAREEVTNRLRIQAERAELVLEDSLSRVQEVVHTMHSGVMRPVREVTGVVAGIRTAFSAYLGGRRPSVAQATHDEEMFI